MADGKETRRWTLSGWHEGSPGTGGVYVEGPELAPGERVEVVALPEYEALNKEAVRLYAAAWRVFDAAGQGEDALADALVALGLILAGEQS